MLDGRERGRAELAALVERARAGRAAVLVLLGEPGVGKSALWMISSRPSGRHRPPGRHACRARPVWSLSRRCRSVRYTGYCAAAGSAPDGRSGPHRAAVRAGEPAHAMAWVDELAPFAAATGMPGAVVAGELGQHLQHLPE